MKKPLTILLSILLTGLGEQMQPQNVFPTSGAIWNIHIDGIEHYYGLTGDTIFNDTIYNKLYLLNDTTLVIDHNDVYIGGLRQEEKKVWFRPDNFPHIFGLGEKESLLHDFSKNVGDTIWHNIFGPQLEWYMRDYVTNSVIVDIYNDNYSRLVYDVNFYLYEKDYNHNFFLKRETWVEGIGSIKKGLFLFLYEPDMTGFPAINLGCIKQNNEVIFIDNKNCKACFDCYFENGYGNIWRNNCTSLKVISYNNAIIINGEQEHFPNDFILFSTLGQLVLQRKLQSNNEEILFNQKGIWIYQIQKNNEIIKTGKLIIK